MRFTFGRLFSGPVLGDGEEGGVNYVLTAHPFPTWTITVTVWKLGREKPTPDLKIITVSRLMSCPPTDAN